MYDKQSIGILLDVPCPGNDGPKGLLAAKIISPLAGLKQENVTICNFKASQTITPITGYHMLNSRMPSKQNPWGSLGMEQVQIISKVLGGLTKGQQLRQAAFIPSACSPKQEPCVYGWFVFRQSNYGRAVFRCHAGHIQKKPIKTMFETKRTYKRFTDIVWLTCLAI